MNKTLFGLSLLSYNWDNYKKDIIDCYIPLVCNLIIKKGYGKVDRGAIQTDLLELYGIKIPLGALETIFKRMVKNELLKKTLGEYNVDFDNVCKAMKNHQKDELEIAFDLFVVDLIEYSRETFTTEFFREEIEDGIIAFFKEYDLDLLFASNSRDSVLPIVKESKKVKYIIAKFITDLQHKEPIKFNTILKLAKGYAIASLITYDDLQLYSGSLSNVNIFLDAPIIFNLLGLNGDSNLRLSKELINTLKSNGAYLKVFEVNYSEVIKTIQESIKRLNSKKYDITKSSRVLRTAIRENISAQQLQIKLNQLDSILQTFGVEKMASPSLEKSENRYQIDEKKLTEIIEEHYKGDVDQKIPWYKVNQIERDVESISNIFKIRKRTQAISLKNSKAILLTCNEVIAYASKRYERSEWEFKSTIPVCVTDIFLSTILWANYPEKNENLNIKQLMSECYDVVELDNRLLNKFYEDVNKMHKENLLSDEQFYLLSASNLAYTLLEQKTFNDIDEYTDKTPSEILEDLQNRANAGIIAEKGKMIRVDNNIRRISKIIAKHVFVLVALFLISLSLLLKVINPQLGKNGLDFVFWCLAGLLSIFGFLRWIEMIPAKTKMESTIEDFVFLKLKNVLNKE